MQNKRPVIIFVALLMLIIGIIYLAQAVEPVRAPVVEIIERERLAP